MSVLTTHASEHDAKWALKYMDFMMISVFCWVLIFLIRLRFPVNKSVAEIISKYIQI